MRLTEMHFIKYLDKHEQELPITEKRRLVRTRMAAESSEAHRQTIFAGEHPEGELI